MRERLLAAASHLFGAKGYAATTVREIVEAAGVTKPVLYYYFGNKEGLYLELMGQALSTVQILTAEALAAMGSARERIAALLDHTFALMLDKLDVVRVMDSIYYGPPQGAPFFNFEAVHRAFEDSVHTLVEEGMASGEFRAADPEAVSFALIGAIEIAKGLQLCHPERAPGREGLARYLDVIFNGVLSGPPQRQEPES